MVASSYPGAAIGTVGDSAVPLSDMDLDPRDSVFVEEAMPATPGKGDPVQTIAAQPPIGIPELDSLELDPDFSSHLATTADVALMMETHGVFDPSVDYTRVVDGHGAGLAPPTLAEWQDMVGSVTMVDGVSLHTVSSLPNKLDLSESPYFPAIGHQGSQNSCTGWAVGYYTNGFLQARDNGWDEAYLGINKGNNVATPIVNAIALLSDVGGSTWSSLPYDNADWKSWGDEQAMREAVEYRVLDFPTVTNTQNPDIIKTWLAQGYAVPMYIAIPNFAFLGTDDPVISSAEIQLVNIDHSVTIVGYDDTMEADGDVGAFKVANSWGSNWGASWDGDGFFWITYDALRKSPQMAWLVRDRVDYQPSLLATFKWYNPGGITFSVYLSVDADPSINVYPRWMWNFAELPATLVLDASDHADWMGASPFRLWATTWQTPRPSITSFEMERYEGDYDPGEPAAVAKATDVPKVASCDIGLTWYGVHVDADSTDEEDWFGGDIPMSGVASPNLTFTLWNDTFESPLSTTWTYEDANPVSGLDTWGWSRSRSRGGGTSLWCAGSDNGYAFIDDFDDPVLIGDTWSTFGTGSDSGPWIKTNGGYRGASAWDYIGLVKSEGVGDVTEWLVSKAPIDCRNFENLTLRFYLDYVAGSGDGYGRVMWANGSTYPTFTLLAGFTRDTLGFKTYDMSFLDGETAVYLAFVYEGTDDRYMAIDDVALSGDKTGHDNNMLARMERDPPDLTSYDTVTLEFSYWLESQDGGDGLRVSYLSGPKQQWLPLWDRNGLERRWTDVIMDLPKDAATVRFDFTGYGTTTYEGAYLDDIRLVATVDLVNVTFILDDREELAVIEGTEWSWLWDTTDVPSGKHIVTVKGTYGPYEALDLLHIGLDRVLPWFGEDASADLVETGEMYIFSIIVEDDYIVNDVWVEYWYDDRSPINKSLFKGDGGFWQDAIIVYDRAKELHFAFGCVDRAGNVNGTVTRTLDVVDIIKPEIYDDGSSTTATTGDPFEFNVTAWDNQGVASVSIWHAFGEDDPIVLDLEEIMTLGDESVRFLLSIDIPVGFAGTMMYHIIVEDLQGNVLNGPLVRVQVADDDGPEIVLDGTADVAYMGDPFEFRAILRDNVGIDCATVRYILGEGPVWEAGMVPGHGDGSYIHTIEIPIDSPDLMTYTFRVVDGAGIVLDGPTKEVEVIDGLPPVITLFLDTGKPAIKGLDFVVTASVEDNLRVDEAFCEYWFGTSSHENESMSAAERYMAWLSLPRRPDGDLHLVISARDTAGNWVSTTEQVVELVNAPPMFNRDMLWYVMEDETAGIDFSKEITDENDALEDLTLSCDSEPFAIDGLRLRVRFDQWVPEQVIFVTVSDGEDEATCQITVRVNAVNDWPDIIAISPENGTQFRKGEFITFHVDVADEEGDDITVTWKSGNVTLGMGQTLEYRGLKPGTHVILVIVSDGTGADGDEFTIVIKKPAKKDSPGFGVVVAFVALMLAMVHTVRRLDRRW
jgi:hypothetical protein